MDRKVEKLLENFYNKSKNGRIVYVPNPGNAGDSVIAAAAFELLKSVGIWERLVITKNILPGDNVIYPGGGNLVGIYNQAESFLEKCLDIDINQFLMLPHTIRNVDKILNKLDNRFTLVCRELVSFEYVNSFDVKFNKHIDDDLVVNADLYAIAQKNVSTELFDFFKKFIPTAKNKAFKRWNREIKKINKNEDGELILMRTDVEAIGNIGTKKSQADLSNLHGSDYSDEYETYGVASGFINTINKSDVVISDRLHVCIVATKLGKDVIMYDNSYGKNKSIYEYSLKDKFKNIKFISENN